MNHIAIICHGRTGGTWLGKVFDTCPTVKYLWEPDIGMSRSNFRQWDFDDHAEIERLVHAFEPHVDIKPHFPKTTLDTAVYKLISPLGQIVNFGYSDPQFREDLIINVVQKLSGKIIHLIRHPVRWIASVEKWGPTHKGNRLKQTDKQLKHSLHMYIKNNLVFHETCSKQPWYTLVKHDDLVMNPQDAVQRLFAFCNLQPTDELFRFLDSCHKKDADKARHTHPTVMSKEGLLTKWQQAENSALIDYANTLTKKYWHRFFDPLF